MTRLRQWGNSVGLTIPEKDLAMVNLHVGDKLEVKANRNGGLSLLPIKDPQAGWQEAFNAVADSDMEDLLLDVENDFDKDEWSW